MWKKAGKAWGCKKKASTGGVGKKGGLSTGVQIFHIHPQTFHNFCG
jgi:hypothetical protein